MILKEVSCAHQGCFYLIEKYSKNSYISELLYFYRTNIFLQFKINDFDFNKFENGIYLADISASLLQSLVSHDPSEITLICWFDA